MQQELFPSDEKKNDDSHLWNQFIRLGEMIGDGLHHEEPWISREYKKLMLILNPDIRESLKLKKVERNKSVDTSIQKLVESKNCSCGGKLIQSRSGSLILNCSVCKTRYKAKKSK